MSYIFDFFATYIAVAIVIELAFLAFIVWGFFHEEKFVVFEDRIIRFVIRRYRRLRFYFKAKLYVIARRAFIRIYGTYRRMVIRCCRRALSAFGMKAVKSNTENSYEVLSR